MRTIVLLAVLVASLVAAVSFAPSARAATTVTDLGRLPGFPVAEADAINNLGQVAGLSALGYTRGTVDHGHAFVWSGSGSLVDIGTLGGDLSFPGGINDHGEVVGGSTTADGVLHAFAWTAGTGMQPLGDGPGVSSRGFAINQTGVVAGLASLPSGQFEAVLWEAGSVMVLPGLPGGQNAAATAINDAGQVAGIADDGNFVFHPVLWDASGIHDLGVLPDTFFSMAAGMNEAGQVVGYFQVFAGPSIVSVAFSWTATEGLRILPTLGGAEASAAAVNAAGSVVGTAQTGSGLEHAVVWTTNGIIDLAAVGSGPFMSAQRQSGAFGINDQGQVCGISGVGGFSDAVVWSIDA